MSEDPPLPLYRELTIQSGYDHSTGIDWDRSEGLTMHSHVRLVCDECSLVLAEGIHSDLDGPPGWSLSRAHALDMAVKWLLDNMELRPEATPVARALLNSEQITSAYQLVEVAHATLD